jgi:hypothetical protein
MSRPDFREVAEACILFGQRAQFEIGQTANAITAALERAYEQGKQDCDYCGIAATQPAQGKGEGCE